MIRKEIKQAHFEWFWRVRLNQHDDIEEWVGFLAAVHRQERRGAMASAGRVRHRTGARFRSGRSPRFDAAAEEVNADIDQAIETLRPRGRRPVS
jgi:hypothetical protein